MSFELRRCLHVRVVAALCGAAVCCALAPQPVAAQSGEGLTIGRYADALGTKNARLSTADRRDLAERLLLLSSYYKLDPALLAAVVSVESSWRANAVSPVGALGFGQLMPGTAAGLDVDALEPYENLDGTARYLRRMLKRYRATDVQTRMRLALASYNAGPAAVARYNGVPPYRETRAYVNDVLRARASFVAAVAHPVPAAGRRVASKRHAGRIAAPAAKPRHARLRAPVAVAVRMTPPTPEPARYERSRSVFARMLGLKHRLTASQSAAVTPDVQPPPAAAYDVALPP
jgi:hypothetical protein